MFENMNHALYVFLCAMMPIVELRGAIPIGAKLGLDFVSCYLLSVVGNLLPIPVILLFVRFVLDWMKKIKYLDKIAFWVEKKAHKHSGQIVKYAGWGLFLFVAVPIPGTGAWTGALIAALLDMRIKKALPVIVLGVLTAGVIVTGISYGVFTFLDFLL